MRQSKAVLRDMADQAVIEAWINDFETSSLNHTEHRLSFKSMSIPLYRPQQDTFASQRLRTKKWAPGE